MNTVQRAQRDMLFALVMEASKGQNWEDDLTKLKSTYDLKISDQLLSASLEPWEDEGLLAVSRHSDGCSAFVKPSRYGTALSRLMELLDAKSFEINWKKEEILTDATPDSSWPGIDGWKILTFEKELRQSPELTFYHDQKMIPPGPTPSWWRKRIDWTMWGTILTGLSIAVGIVLWKFS